MIHAHGCVGFWSQLQQWSCEDEPITLVWGGNGWQMMYFVWMWLSIVRVSQVTRSFPRFRCRLRKRFWKRTGGEFFHFWGQFGATYHIKSGEITPMFVGWKISPVKPAVIEVSYATFIGDYTTHVQYMGIIINHYIRIPIKQPGFVMESNNGFFRGSFQQTLRGNFPESRKARSFLFVHRNLNLQRPLVEQPGFQWTWVGP